MARRRPPMITAYAGRNRLVTDFAAEFPRSVRGTPRHAAVGLVAEPGDSPAFSIGGCASADRLEVRAAHGGPRGWRWLRPRAAARLRERAARLSLAIIEEDRLDPAHTFETFVVSAGNRFAHAAAVAVAESPAGPLQPAVHLRRLRAGQDTPAASHRAVRRDGRQRAACPIRGGPTIHR
jgi:hypothetical protein